MSERSTERERIHLKIHVRKHGAEWRNSDGKRDRKIN